MQRGFRRRSEVDRRLDNLVGNNGKLREAGLNSVIKMLRLFNLCDLGNNGTAGSVLAKVSEHKSMHCKCIKVRYPRNQSLEHLTISAEPGEL